MIYTQLLAACEKNIFHFFCFNKLAKNNSFFMSSIPYLHVHLQPLQDSSKQMESVEKSAEYAHNKEDNKSSHIISILVIYL